MRQWRVIRIEFMPALKAKDAGFLCDFEAGVQVEEAFRRGEKAIRIQFYDPEQIDRATGELKPGAKGAIVLPHVHQIDRTLVFSLTHREITTVPELHAMFQESEQAEAESVAGKGGKK